MAISKSARLFLERAGVKPTFRLPLPTFHPTANAVRNQPLEPPLPIAEAISNGEPPPDRGLTKEPWPHGTDCSE